MVEQNIPRLKLIGDGRNPVYSGSSIYKGSEVGRAPRRKERPEAWSGRGGGGGGEAEDKAARWALEKTMRRLLG